MKILENSVITATIGQIFLRVMQYCPISLLFSLPAVASDFGLTEWSESATIAGLIASIVAIFIASWAFYTQKKSLEQQIDDSKTADENTKKALAKQDEMIEQQKVLGAWSLLAQKGTGDLGRKDALEFLHSKGKSLVGLDLTGAFLFGLKLNGADLSNCNFSGANLWGAVFVGTTLYGANFEGADLGMVRFEGADVRDTNFEGASLVKARFNNADLYGANFKLAVLLATVFKGAKLWDVNFEDAVLMHAYFEGAENIEHATFNNCYVVDSSEDNLPTAPEGFKFVKTTLKTKDDRLAWYYIKLEPTKKP